MTGISPSRRREGLFCTFLTGKNGKGRGLTRESERFKPEVYDKTGETGGQEPRVHHY